MVMTGKRYYYYFLIAILAYNFDQFIWVFDYATTVNLVTRSFDNIPTFQEYGFYGNFLRFIFWPLITITGLFAFISPHILFFFVFVGVIFNLFYMFLVQKNLNLDLTLKVFLVLGAIALIVPGYTTYIRYVYPVLVIWPLLQLELTNKK